MIAELQSSGRVAPTWADEAFALPEDEEGRFTINGIAFTLRAKSLRLEPHLRPLQIVRVHVSADASAHGSSCRLRDLMDAARRHQRPLEARIEAAGLDRNIDPWAYAEALRRSILGFDTLGFHVTEGVSYETLDAVTVAYLPDGLPIPFGDEHRRIARHMSGLDGGGRADRNAILAAVASPTYARLMEMRAAGYAMKADTLAGRAFFGLTAKGFAATLRPDDRMIWSAPPDKIILDGRR